MNNETIDHVGPDYKRLVASLRKLELIQSSEPTIVALAGGVSSLIVRVDDGDRSFCAKSALEKLKVEADWRVPVHRNQAEVAWMRKAAVIVPAAVPEILGSDPQQNIFAMQWLDPDSHPVWKQNLLGEKVSASFANTVGTVLGKIHAGTAGDESLAAEFANESDFFALRLEPYLHATALVHPQLADQLLRLSNTTAQTRHVLIHGDVSPKNILAGPEGPVFLDAECATYGDPAFDLAFCLNHLILKAVHKTGSVDALSDSFRELAQSYLSYVHWEPMADIEARAAALLPALALARIDGKSPVEYLTPAEQQRVRHNALQLIRTPVTKLDELLNIWRDSLT